MSARRPGRASGRAGSDFAAVPFTMCVAAACPMNCSFSQWLARTLLPCDLDEPCDLCLTALHCVESCQHVFVHRTCAHSELYLSCEDEYGAEQRICSLTILLVRGFHLHTASSCAVSSEQPPWQPRAADMLETPSIDQTSRGSPCRHQLQQARHAYLPSCGSRLVISLLSSTTVCPCRAPPAWAQDRLRRAQAHLEMRDCIRVRHQNDITCTRPYQLPPLAECLISHSYRSKINSTQVRPAGVGCTPVHDHAPLIRHAPRAKRGTHHVAREAGDS
jgi:hypothetical protein